MDLRGLGILPVHPPAALRVLPLKDQVSLQGIRQCRRLDNRNLSGRWSHHGDPILHHHRPILQRRELRILRLALRLMSIMRHHLTNCDGLLLKGDKHVHRSRIDLRNSSHRLLCRLRYSLE